MYIFTKFDKVLIVLAGVAMVMLAITQDYLVQDQKNNFELDKMKVFNAENCQRVSVPAPAK
jgi:cell division protein FtsL